MTTVMMLLSHRRRHLFPISTRQSALTLLMVAASFVGVVTRALGTLSVHRPGYSPHTQTYTHIHTEAGRDSYTLHNIHHPSPSLHHRYQGARAGFSPWASTATRCYGPRA